MKKTLYLFVCTAALSSHSKGQISLVGDMNAGTASSSPALLTPFNNKLYMSAKTAAAGIEMFACDGSSAPALVEDINPGTGNGMSSNFSNVYTATLGDFLYFAGNNGDGKGYELMRKGLSGPALRAGMEIYTGPATGEPLNITAFKDKIYFTADAPATTGRELYVYNPATDTTALAADINVGIQGSSADNFCAYKDKLYFSAYTPALGRELYSYDPATGTSTLVADIEPGLSSSVPYFLRVIGDKLYFIANTIANGYEIYQYDGVTATRLTDVNPGAGNGITGRLGWYKNKIYFAGDDGTSGSQLYSYDPATAATSLVYTFHPDGGFPVLFTNYGGKLYFQANDMANGMELWETDGTTTKMVQDLYVGGAGTPNYLTVWKGKLYFSAQTAASGTELFSLVTPEGLGLDNVSFKGSVILAPNPATGHTRLLLNLDETQRLQIAISDISGKTLYQHPVSQYQSGRHEVVLPVGNYASGTYFYTIADAEGKTQMTGQFSKF